MPKPEFPLLKSENISHSEKKSSFQSTALSIDLGRIITFTTAAVRPTPELPLPVVYCDLKIFV
jgi:hypothetical protein